MLSSLCRCESRASTTSVLLSTEHLPHKYISRSHTHRHTHSYYNQIEGGRAAGTKKEDRQRQMRGAEKQMGSRERGRAEDEESCVLNIPHPSDPSVSHALIFELAGHQRSRDKESQTRTTRTVSSTLTAVSLLFLNFAPARILVVQAADRRGSAYIAAFASSRVLL